MNKIEQLYRKVLEQISPERCTKLLQALIRERCTSWTDEPSECNKFIRKELERIRFKVKEYKVPVSEPDYRYAGKDKYLVNPLVVGTLEGKKRKPVLILEAHYDTQVVDLDLWEYGPFAGELIDGVIYGRGTVDSKGQLAAMIEAVEAIELAGVELKGNLIMACPPDGEFGGRGWNLLVDLELADLADWIISGEATYNVKKKCFEIALAYAPSWSFQITITGKAAHIGEPESGVNAINAASKLLVALPNLQFSFTPWQWSDSQTGLPRLSILNIKSTSKFVVPDKCIIGGFIEGVPSMSRESVRSILQKCINKVFGKERNGVSVELRIVQRHTTVEVSKHNPCVRALDEAVKISTGKEAGLSVFRLLSCGAPRIFRTMNPGKTHGKPAAITFGGGDPSLAHSDLEYISVDDLIKTAKIYALTIVKLLG